MNHVILIGNLGRDPEARGSERNIASFSLAVKHWKKGGEGETQWFDCVAFGKTGQTILAHVKKGDKLAITGKIKTKVWERDGIKRQDLDIVIDSWQFVGSKPVWEEVGSKPTSNAISNQGPATWEPDGNKWP